LPSQAMPGYTSWLTPFCFHAWIIG
jgi:hypothetical protein